MKKNDITINRAKKHIMLPAEARQQLAKDFEVSEMTVSKALRFIGNSSTVNLIRTAALQRGGAIYDPSARLRAIKTTNSTL